MHKNGIRLILKNPDPEEFERKALRYNAIGEGVL
jgi:hypothetical protein